MDIDFLLEAVKEDPQTYRDLARFARDNPKPKVNPLAARMAAEQARKDAHRGAAADSRDVKRVSDYDKVGGVTTLGDLAAKYDSVKTAKRNLALAVLKVERALSCQTEEGHDLNEKNIPAAVNKAVVGLQEALTKARTVGAVNSGVINYYKELIKDCKQNIDLEDEVERNSAVRDVVLNTKRFGLDKYINDSDSPVPKNTPVGPEKASWLANVHGENGKDSRDAKLKKADKEVEDASYAKMKEIASASERLRTAIRKGDLPEGSSIKDLIEKENKERAAEGKPTSQRYTNNFQSMASPERLKELNIFALKDRPVEGCDNVKALVKKWKENGKQPAGQIEIVYRPAKLPEGAAKYDVQTKPVVYIAGNYYSVPQNDLFTKAQNGIAMPEDKDGNPNPYIGYVRPYKVSQKDPKHADIRAKLKVHSSVVTEEKNFFEY